jgi:hypothetical protein
VPELADLAALTLRRCYEQLDPGGAGSLAAAVRLAWPFEHDEAIPARDKVLAGLTEAQAAVLNLKHAIIRRSRQDELRRCGARSRGSGKGRGIWKANQPFVMAA